VDVVVFILSLQLLFFFFSLFHLKTPAGPALNQTHWPLTNSSFSICLPKIFPHPLGSLAFGLALLYPGANYCIVFPPLFPLSNLSAPQGGGFPGLSDVCQAPPPFENFVRFFFF